MTEPPGDDPGSPAPPGVSTSPTPHPAGRAPSETVTNRYRRLEGFADLGEGAEEFDSTHRFTRPVERAEIERKSFGPTVSEKKMPPTTAGKQQVEGETSSVATHQEVQDND